MNTLTGIVHRHEAYSKAMVLKRLGISQRFWDKMLDDGLPFSIIGQTRWVTGEALIRYFEKCAKTKNRRSRGERNGSQT